MSLTQITNLRHPELVKRMSQFVDMNIALPSIFRGVYTKHNDDWSLLLGTITIGDSVLDSNYQECWHTYPNYQFICKPIQSLKLAKLMERLNIDGQLSIPDIPEVTSKEQSLNWTESLIPSHVSTNSFPIKRFAARLRSNVHCFNSKLLAYGMDFHPSAFEYVRKFLNLEQFHGDSDGRKGELFIDIPDQRGHIELSNKKIRYHCMTTEKLSIVGAINGEPVNFNTCQDACSIEPEKATDLELWLVTDSNEIVDYCSSSDSQYRYSTQTDNSDITKLLQIIAEGESEHCEFKPYIDLVSKKNAKAWELDKTVCAFSNHQGGKLFIGVDDETRIIGINDGCERDYKETPLASTKIYQTAVTKRLKESLNKNQCFSVKLIEHQELFLLVITIHKVNGLNYLLNTKNAYIRRGASSPQMTPSEIQEFPRERDALGHEMLKGEYGLDGDFSNG
jgi:hypothetical protein